MARITFRCGGCQARIKAPYQLHGQRRSCPGCGHRFIVRAQRPQDSGPVLVDDGLFSGSKKA
jgi:DNA-directed RNA polymerase subunit RPC12/RpoP